MVLHMQELDYLYIGAQGQCNRWVRFIGGTQVGDKDDGGLRCRTGGCKTVTAIRTSAGISPLNLMHN